jgi:hypothetical protein
MINVNQITSQLAKMPDPMLQKYAAMHKDDPYTVALALSESNRRKAMRVGASPMPGEQPKVVDQDIAEMSPPTQQMPQQMPQQMAKQQLPEDTGIGQLPAPNMQRMADGGIVGYAGDQGSVTRMTGADLFNKALDEEGITDPLRRAFAKAIHGQESSGRVNAPTSNRGAGGPMQVRTGAWTDVATPDMDRKNPFDNMRAGIRYAMKGFDAAKGDPVLAGAHYYGGPGGMKKLMEGKAVSDPENPKAPNTAEYGASVAKRMTAFLPIGAAAAATPEKPVVPTAAPVAVSRGTNEVPQAVDFSKPAQTTAAPVAPRSQFQAMLDAGRGIVGAGETALQYGTGMLAIPTAGVASLLGSKTTQEAEDKYRKYAGDVTYQPRTEAGQNISESTRRVLEDLKVPPVLAHAGNLPPRRGGAKVSPAELSELANRMTKEAETPRLAGPTTSETMIQGRDQPPVRQGAAVAQQMADIENAKAFQQAAAANKANERIPSTTPEVLERNAQLARAQAVSAGSSPASNAGLATLSQNQPNKGLPMDDLGFDRSGLDALSQPEVKGGVEDLITSTAKDAGVKPSKFKDDMALMFFLNLMGGKSPNALTNASTAGISALKYGQELKKEESEQLYREALGKKYGTPSEIQMLEYLKDPKNMANYMQQREAMRDPMTKEALYKLFMASPQAMAEPDPEKLGKSFQNFVSTYENQFGPLGGKLPSGVKVSRAGT